MKPEDRIKFALEFAEMDLERVFRRPESLASFRNEFYEFHYGRGGESFADRGGILAIPDSEFASWKLAEFLTLQKKCRRFVAECAHGSPPRMAIPEMTLTAKYGLIKLAHDEIAFPMIRGSAHDLFMIVLWHLIAGAAGEHIGRCPEPNVETSSSGPLGGRCIAPRRARVVPGSGDFAQAPLSQAESL